MFHFKSRLSAYTGGGGLFFSNDGLPYQSVWQDWQSSRPIDAIYWDFAHSIGKKGTETDYFSKKQINCRTQNIAIGKTSYVYFCLFPSVSRHFQLHVHHHIYHHVGHNLKDLLTKYHQHNFPFGPPNITYQKYRKPPR